MKKIMLIALTIMLCASTSMADNGWKEISTERQCARFKTMPDLNGIVRMLIETADMMTVDKEQRAATASACNKNCSDIGKSLRQEILKIRYVTNVIVTPYQMAVYKGGYGKWDDIETKVIDLLNDMVCK